jgi:maleylpyruvate isomerase
VLEHLRKQFSANEEAIDAWCGAWIAAGFDAYEAILATDKFRMGFSFGAVASMADVYLIPQIESARRFKVKLDRWPRIMEVNAHCAKIDAFMRAVPSLQLDAA